MTGIRQIGKIRPGRKERERRFRKERCEVRGEEREEGHRHVSVPFVTYKQNQFKVRMEGEDGRLGRVRCEVREEERKEGQRCVNVLNV